MLDSKRFKIDAVELEIYPDKHLLGAAAAQFVADGINVAIKNRGEANVIFATGASQYEFLEALLQLENVAWPKVNAFHLDEYLGLADDHPASFRRYLRERLFGRLPFAQIHLLAGDAPDPSTECARYETLLRNRVIDIACIGIGENGHLAFNDPPADFETEALVHIVTLDLACRQQQVGEGHFNSVAEVPQQALSLTIPAILSAKLISCVVPDARKSQAVQCALTGPIRSDCPASALRCHHNCRLYLDQGSASALAQS